jgi:hypothetical protein
MLLLVKVTFNAPIARPTETMNVILLYHAAAESRDSMRTGTFLCDNVSANPGNEQTRMRV